MHDPVLLDEVVSLLEVKEGGLYVDGTAGSGGHALALLERMGPRGRLLGIDRDEAALQRVRVRLAGREPVFVLAQGAYGDMARLVAEQGWGQVDGVLLDLGVSSEQLDDPERGFSFMRDGPLDMRMDRGQSRTAADLVSDLDEDALRRVIRTYGEEPGAKRIASAIVRERRGEPITTTGRLAAVVSDAMGGRRGPKHPATRTFQALRMAVNEELKLLEEGLEAALSVVAPGGRLAVISFHSLEDRMVKTFLKRHAGRWESLAAGGEAWEGEIPAVRLVNRKVVVPSKEEQARNPRARSAKLRVAERIPSPGEAGG